MTESVNTTSLFAKLMMDKTKIAEANLCPRLSSVAVPEKEIGRVTEKMEFECE
jgi:hypothetical protein